MYDNDGTSQLGAIQGYAQSTISFTSTGLAAGTYYIRVFATGGSYAGYTLNASLNPNTYPNDGVFNNYFSAAPSFAQNDSIRGHIAYRSNGGNYDYNDYFSFYSNGDYDITISLTNNNNNYVYIYLYDTDTTTQIGASQGYAQGGISFTTTGLAAGTYFVRVFATVGSYSGYTLKNSYTADGIVNDVEPNNTTAQATSTSYNSTNTGHIAYRQTGGSYDYDDYYIFNTPADGNITFSLTNNNNNYAYIYLYDSDGISQLGASQGYAQGGIAFSVNGLNAGTYYARVSATAGSYSGYTLTKSFTATPNANDAEPNGSVATALIFNPNSSATGHIAHRLNGNVYDNYDYYKIVTTADGNISLNLTNDNNNYNYLYLYDSDGVTQLTATQGYGQATLTCSASGLAAGTYYVLVYAGAGSYAGYSLTNTFTPAAFNNDVEDNNSFATASVLNNNVNKQGHIAYRSNGGAFDNYDYWKITMLQTDSVRLDLTMANTNYSYIYFYDGSQNQLYATQGFNSSYSVFFNSLPAGDYYLLVYASAGYYNSYSIDHFYYPCNTGASAIAAGGATTFCQPGSVALNSVSAYASYLWSNGATTGSINATTSGTYTLTASDNDACPHISNSISVTAIPSPAPVIMPDGPTTFCSGGSVTLDAGAGYSSYAWSNGATSQSINVSATGTFTVTVTNGTCPGTSTPVSVNVTATGTPTITANGPITFCAGGNVQLTATVGTGYLWSNGATTQSITVNNNGSFMVTVTAAGGCSGTSAATTVTVNPLPTVTLGSFADVCDNAASFALTGGSPAGGTYSGAGVSGGNFSPATAGVGTHAITYSYTDGNGCPGSATSGITVNLCGCTSPNAPVAVDGPQGVCRGQNSVTFSVTNDPTATSYQWTLPSGMTGSSSTNSISVNVSNSYNTASICVKAINACGQSSSTCKSVTRYTVKPGQPGAISGSTNVCDGFTQIYNVASVTNATTYSWTIPSGVTLISGQGTNSISVSFSASYSSGTLKVKASNCIGSSVDRTLAVYGFPAVPHPSFVNFPENGVCAGSTKSYSIQPMAGVSSYTWGAPAGAAISDGTNSGNPLTTSSTSVQITFALNFTSGAITIAGNNVCGMGSVRSRNVYSTPFQPGAISGPLFALCGATAQTFSVPAVSGATSYQWSVPAGASIQGINSGNSVSVNFPSNFNIGNICVVAVNGCGNSVSRCLSVQGRPGPMSAISGSASVCKSQSSVAYGISTVPRAVTYQWSATNAALVSGSGINVSLNFNNVTKTSVVLTAKAVNACGASNSSTRTIAVANCREEGYAADEMGKSSISVYPNPASNQCIVKLNSEKEGKVQLMIHDLSGRNVHSQVFKVVEGLNDFSIDISHVAKGCYMVSVICEGGSNETRLVVQ